MLVNKQTNSSQESKLFCYSTNCEQGQLFLEVRAEGIADVLVGGTWGLLSKVKNEIDSMLQQAEWKKDQFSSFSSKKAITMIDYPESHSH